MKKILLPALLSFVLLFSYASNIFAAENLEPVNLIPKMTSNTSPSGIASASTEWSTNHKAFSVFDGTINDVGWCTAKNTPTGWISYEFENPVVVNNYSIQPRGLYVYKTESPRDWTFEGWNGTSWVILDEYTN